MKPIFTETQIKALFPFHLLINRDFEILQTGNLVSKLLSINPVKGRLFEHFAIRELPEEPTFDCLLNSCNESVYLESTKGNIVLKGAFYESADPDQLIFIGNIRPDHLLKHCKNKITLKDIPAYDSFNDFLFSHRANAKAFEEVQLLLRKSADEVQLTKSLTKDIRESERRYHDFIEHSQEGIWRLEFTPPLVIKKPPGKLAKQLLYEGAIVECNDAMAQMFGCEKAEAFYGKRLIDLFAPGSKGDEQSAIDKAKAFIKGNFKANEIISHEQDKGGNDIYISNSTTGVIENGHLLRLWGMQRNVTHQVLAEQAVKEREERLSKFMNSTTDSCVILDSELNITEINDITLNWMNKKREEAINKHILELSPTLKQQGRYDEYLKVIETGEPFDLLDEIPIPGTGTIMYLHIRAFKVGDGLGLVTTNLTEHKQAEQAIKASEEKYRRLLETMNEGVMQVDNESNIVYVNNRFCEMVGYKRKELIGKNTNSLLSINKKASRQIAGRIKERLRGESGTYEMQMRKKSGEYIWVYASGAPVYDGNGNVIGSIGVSADITKRKEAEQKVHLQYLKLRKYAFITSHDLRRPISTIQGLVNVFNYDQPDDPFNKMVLEKFKTAVDEMDHVTRQTNDLLMGDDLLADEELEEPEVKKARNLL